MELMIIAIVGLGALIFVGFLVAWLADARRAEQVEHDPERLHTDSLEGTESAELPQELPHRRGRE